MKIRFSLLTLSLMSAVAATAAPAGRPTAEEVEKAMAALGQMAGAMQQQPGQPGQPAGLVDFRQLKALLPETVAGCKRTSATGEKNSAMGISTASARGEYEGANDKSFTIEYTDMGGMGGMAALAQMGFNAAEIDRETDTGYEKTYTYKGIKVREEYDTENKSGEIEAMFGGHFQIKISGSNIAAEELKQALDAVDVQKISALKPQP